MSNIISCFFFNFIAAVKEKFKAEGYDILSLSMTGLGYNMLLNPNFSFPVNPERNFNISFNYKVHISELGSHDIYRYYYDENYPNVNIPLRS